jgi:hypothetical protein
MADTEQLWNPTTKPRLPDLKRARNIASQVLLSANLVKSAPRAAFADSDVARVDMSFCHNAKTMGVANGGAAEPVALDLQLIFLASLDVPVEGRRHNMPVTGGGGKFRVAFGHQGSVIGLSGGWRTIESVEAVRPIKSKSEAQAEFAKLFPGAKLTNVRSHLAYYSAPAFERQTHLVPVWECGANLMLDDGREVPIRPQTIPAIDEFPAFTRGEASGEPSREPVRTPRAPGEDPQFECGAAWIGVPQSAFEADKNGFLEECQARGAQVNFDVGNAQANVSLFHANAPTQAEKTDVVFYTGHADHNGWVMNNEFLTFDASQPPLQFGTADMEWLIIAACGPLHSSHFRPSMSSAFTRWGGTFDGLHGMLGFGSLSHAHPNEGRRFVQLAAEHSMVDAWLRTAIEVQPCSTLGDRATNRGIFAVALYAHNGDHCARHEKLLGPSCADVGNDARQLHMIWTQM